MTSRDITKLPKWAQHEIRRLQLDLEAAYAALNEGEDNSTVFANPYSDARRPLGTDPTIEFEIPDPNNPISSRVEVRRDGRGIRIMGGTRIAVFPQAANVVQIRIVR